MAEIEADIKEILTPPEASTRQARGWRQTFASLENPDFRWFWVGMLNYFMGMMMEGVARGWLAYRITDNSATALGVMSAAWGLPILFLAPFAGVVADRVNKRNLIIVAQGFIGLVALIMTILIWTGHIQFWHLLVAGIFMGSFSAFNMPVYQALVPELVPSSRLMNAIALNSSAMNLTRVAGPALAGVLVGLVDVQGVYIVVTACYVLGVVSQLQVPNRFRGRTGVTTSVLSDLMAGLRYIRGHSLILMLLVQVTAVVLFGMPYQNFMPVFAVKVFKVGADGMGLLMAAAGFGALIGTLSIASLGNFQRKGILLIIMGLVFATFLILFANAPNFYLGIGLLVVAGLGGTGYFAVNNTLILTNITPEMRGRVMSIYMVTFGLMPFGALPAGVLVEALGAPLTVSLGGLILIVVIAFATILVPTLRRQP